MDRRVLDDPAWFGAVMGTGATAAALTMNPGARPETAAPTRLLGLGLLALAVAALAALGFRGLRRRGLTRRVPADLRSPITGASYATIPGAVNVVAIGTIYAWPALTGTPLGWLVVAFLAFVGTGAGLWLTVVFFASAFEHPGLEARTISGVWFIPETVVLLGALLVADLATTGPEAVRRSLAVTGLGLLGAGGLLFAVTAMLFVNRLVLHPHDSTTGVPALWIMISPLAVASLALQAVSRDLALLRGTVTVPVSEAATFLASLLWGFALWWVAAAAVVTRHAGRSARTRTASDWAFVFPLAALVIATLTLARHWDSGLAEAAGALLSVALLAVWATVASGSVSRWREERALAHGRPGRPRRAG